MWSHYGDKHEGICIEYDISKSSPCTNYLYPVIYKEERKNLDTFLNEINRNNKGNRYQGFIASALFKYITWNYEKEWRIISPIRMKEDECLFEGSSIYEINRDKGKTMPSPKISAVYLGARISDYNKEIIEKLCKEKRIKCYTSELRHDSYSLIFREL